MKTCSECNKDFDPATRGRGALTCSDACARKRSTRLDRGRYRVDKLAADALEAARMQHNPRWAKCNATECKTIIRSKQRATGFCNKCEMQSRRDGSYGEEIARSRDMLADLDALVRKRAPAGRAWWWR